MLAPADQQAAVLQNSSATTPLSTAQDFLAGDHDVPRIAATEAQKLPFAFGNRLTAERRVDPPLSQRL